MNIAFYSGVSGLVAYQRDMDQIAHNIANVNTVGYKPSRSVFSDLLYSRMAVNSQEDFLVGHGVRVQDKDLIFRQGPVISSGSPLDFGIIGSGFFAVQRGTGEGSIQYTRSGAFDISIEAGGAYLVADDGAYVLGPTNQRIQLTRAADGTFDLSRLPEQIGIFQFGNPFGLEQTTGTRFIPTAVSGAAQTPNANNNNTPYRLVSGALEQSAVELSDEMVMVIQSQKAFQFSARIVQTADQVEEIINNLR